MMCYKNNYEPDVKNISILPVSNNKQPMTLLTFLGEMKIPRKIRVNLRLLVYGNSMLCVYLGACMYAETKSIRPLKWMWGLSHSGEF